jgi:peroxiredoxin
MRLLTAAVVLVGALSLINLLLTFGVIRRMREDATYRVTRVMPPPEAITAVGRAPESFEATTTDGSPFATGSLTDWTVVAFFAADCPTCTEKLPQFVEDARPLRGSDRSVVAVVGADEGTGDAMVSMLEGAAQVVLEPVDGPVAKAFRVRQLPMMCLLNPAGVVVATGYDIGSLLHAAR